MSNFDTNKMRADKRNFEREYILREVRRGNRRATNLTILDIFYEVSEKLDDNLFAVAVGVRHFIYKSNAVKRVDNYRIIEDLRNLNLEKYTEYLMKLVDMDNEEIRKFLWIAKLDLSGFLGELQVLDTNIDVLNIKNKKQIAGNLRKISLYTKDIANKILEERIA